MFKFNLLMIILASYALTPKIGFGNSFIYFQDVFLYFYILTFVFTGRATTKFLNILCVVWFFQVYLMISFLFTNEIIHLKYFKQFLIFNLLLIPSKKFESCIDIKRVFDVWLFVGVINLLYIMLIFFVENTNYLLYLFEYSPKYRIIGMTGSGYDLMNGIFRSSLNGTEIGTTTISLSILYSLALLHVSVSTNLNKIKTLILFGLVLMTMSRAGSLIVFVSFFVIFCVSQKMRVRWFKNNFWLFIVIGLLVVLTIQGNLLINKFDLSNIQTSITVFERLKLWDSIIKFFTDNPNDMLFGLVVLSKDASTIMHTYLGGPGYAESLFLDILLNYGLIGFTASVLIFCIIWVLINIKGNQDNPERIALILFMPGFMIVNTVSGSSFLTDFMLPIILIMFVLGTKKNG